LSPLSMEQKRLTARRTRRGCRAFYIVSVTSAGGRVLCSVAILVGLSVRPFVPQNGPIYYEQRTKCANPGQGGYACCSPPSTVDILL